MTDNEIIKALECCERAENCGHCHYDQDYKEMKDCTSALAKDALALINRQKAEIERLKKFIEEDQGLILKLTGVPVEEYNQKIRTEAIKEFAERLKATFPPREDDRCTLDDCYTLDLIDNLVKEMTEKGGAE